MASTNTSRSLNRDFYWQLILIILAAVSFRLLISIWPHSGEGKPPMHGDLEAQRHWMEITSNLPADQWYVSGPDNDLQYWGLDYPPLTAYHMLLNGKVAQELKPELVELNSSWGLEDQGAKLFMRLSALVMDLLVFIPATVAYFIFRQPRISNQNQILAFIIVTAFYPGLALIDNGHFQYNNVSLGLVILATLAITLRQDICAAVLFCFALNYKQMELYHALPFFGYLLGRCIQLGSLKGWFKLVSLGTVVIVSFATIWSPFLQSLESTQAVIQRLFPFDRGLYEDKVANFWCSISPVIKFKDIIHPQLMAKICMAVTGLFSLPSFIDLIRHPSSVKRFQFALINSSLIFFLFSFHVHEKSILIAAVPACLVIDKEPLAVIWFLIISVFSMLPLLMKDLLLIPTCASLGLYWIGINHFLDLSSRKSSIVVHGMQLSLLGCVCLTIATLLIPAPQRLPDLFQLFIAVYSFAHFCMFALYFHCRQLEKKIPEKMLRNLNEILGKTKSV